MKTREAALEAFLRQTQADQGGEATWENWLSCVARYEDEYAHSEAIEYLVLAHARLTQELDESNLAQHQTDARVDYAVKALHVIRSQSTGPDWTPEQALVFVKDFAGATLTKLRGMP